MRVEEERDFILGSVDLPNYVSSSLVNLPPGWMPSITMFLKRVIAYKLGLHEKRYGHTICISHAAPSAIYLKQRSQTHNMLFSPERCDRVRPPAKRSEVRPCDLTVALLTPGILEVEAELPGNPALSSSSESVSG
jgi:hypothetical protein